MNNKQEYKIAKLDALDGCIGHLTIAIQEIGGYIDFAFIKHDLENILKQVKEKKGWIKNAQ